MKNAENKVSELVDYDIFGHEEGVGCALATLLFCLVYGESLAS